MKKYLVTAALPYANGPLHIGHLAGVYIPADIFCRYQRAKGNDILFVGGSDEHGVPITLRAKKEGVSPQEIVNKYHKLIKNTFKKLDISFDNYSRSSSPLHHKISQEVFTTLYEKGCFIEKESNQFYDESIQTFLADRYITGTCPKCQYEHAYGDQCEQCGSTLSPDELINPKSTFSGQIPKKKKTKHWYLPLDKYEDFLNQWILNEHKEWKANVYGQCKSWLDQGLKPRAMTRDLNWGVAVPSTIPNAKGKVLYVWFDAPIGYLSSTEEWAKKKGKKWQDYWKDSERKLVHFIGKDNIVFHCITFPCVLKAMGNMSLPTQVPANEFMNLENSKVSTSRQHAVWVNDFIDENPTKIDVLRYVISANIPEVKDSDFTWKDFQTRNNSELVGILGNFVNRYFVLMQKYCNGIVPQMGIVTNEEKIVAEVLKKQNHKLNFALDNYKFRDGIVEMLEIARLGNKYLTETQPWKETDVNRINTIMYFTTQVVANLCISIAPFMPFTYKKLYKMLNTSALSWLNLGQINIIDENHEIENAEHLFCIIEDEFVTAQRKKLIKNDKMKIEHTENKKNDVNFSCPDLKSPISFDEFLKLDLRVGTILNAKPVEKSNKLLELLIDLGKDKKTILSGIAKHYNPDTLIGKQVIVLVNLPPRKMMGINSEGMVLMGEDEEGLKIIHPDKKTHNGAIIS